MKLLAAVFLAIIVVLNLELSDITQMLIFLAINFISMFYIISRR